MEKLEVMGAEPSSFLLFPLFFHKIYCIYRRPTPCFLVQKRSLACLLAPLFLCQNIILPSPSQLPCSSPSSHSHQFSHRFNKDQTITTNFSKKSFQLLSIFFHFFPIFCQFPNFQTHPCTPSPLHLCTLHLHTCIPVPPAHLHLHPCTPAPYAPAPLYSGATCTPVPLCTAVASSLGRSRSLCLILVNVWACPCTFSLISPGLIVAYI